VRHLRLLYVAGDPVADQFFAAWLKRNSHQLDSLTIRGRFNNTSSIVLEALAAAAAAALAAGRPLPLHTLRLLVDSVDLRITGRLLVSLVNLCTLQLYDNTDVEYKECPPAGGLTEGQQHLAPLQQATQLQELHLNGTRLSNGYSDGMAGLLPMGLKCLSWSSSSLQAAHRLPSLSHLTELTRLRLSLWYYEQDSGVKLPPHLQELELHCACDYPEALLEQQDVLTGCVCRTWSLACHIPEHLPSSRPPM
jgi:hypothetical protein